MRRQLPVDRPLLGICLGLQWMFEGSSEAPELRGLGDVRRGVHAFFRPGEVAARGMGQHCDRCALAAAGGHSVGRVCVFHALYRAPVCSDTVATCTYEEPFTAAAERGNLFGVQFHPEKSGDVGLQILENFCAL